MSDYPNAPHELGWDDEITNDSSYVLLDEGDYQFTVTAFERARFPGSAKIPPCSKAIFTLAVETSEGTAFVPYEIIMWSTFDWKRAEFFRAIGQKKRGEPLRPRWNETVGSQGRGHFKTRTFTKKDGTEGTVNDVEKLYDYDPAAMTTGGGWTDAGNVPTPWDSEAF